MPKRKPRDIDIDRMSSELVVLWRDGGESRYGLEALRRACPCAECCEIRGAEEQANGLTLLKPKVMSATAEVRGFSYVGRYGIKIEWADGHDHGIYTFDFFRELAR